jgi:hypothetical protein
MNRKSFATSVSCGLVALAMPLAVNAQSAARPAAHVPPPAVFSGSHSLRCLAPDEKTPCSRDQVEQLEQMVVTGRRSYEPLAAVASVSLASPDGTLRCTQVNGAPCTAAQIQALQQYAAAKKKKGSGGCICVMKEIDAASP